MDRSESNTGENVLKKLVKYGSSDNLTEQQTSTRVEKSSELSEEIRLLRERNSSLRVRLNI